jgi:hypothetical protein
VKPPAMRRIRRATALLCLPALVITLPLQASAESETASSSEVYDTAAATLEEPDLVTLLVPDEQTAARLVGLGVDLSHYRKPVAGGIEVHAMINTAEQAELKALGFDVRGTIASAEQMEAVAEQRLEHLDTLAAMEDVAADSLNVLRAEWFTSLGGQKFLNIEVRSSLGTDSTTVVQVSWDGGGATLSRFVDGGQYMYHRFTSPLPVDEVPERITLTSSKGGTVSVPVTQWLGGPRSVPDETLATGFVDNYMDPTQLTARIEALAAEFPQLAEVIELPYKSNGYRRHAQAIIGSTASNQLAGTFYVTSKAWGHQGGNDLGVTVVAQGNNTPLSVAVSGNDVTVNVATNGEGAAVSTAAEVVAAINGSAEASALLTATPYRTSNGTGVVAARERVALTDGLAAPAHISREPFQLKAIRIGKVRDGSKTGIYAYGQEHAREWVTPLVNIETAERLLRNYATNDDVRRLVDNLDIFIQPVVNPDGAHYSFYDRAGQRRNMTNHCSPAESDPGYRGNWGVDLNRNFTVGSYYDGYSGASANCRSDTFAGPSELSEPEAKNEVWMTEQFPNIKFSMNVHSYGGYFMWSPGAYKMPGREPLPRPDFGIESYFWQASEHILERVQSHRNNATWPGRSGPIIDVLYSAAGNSGDDHWYERGIYAWTFEVGTDLWNPETRRFQAVGFQPAFSEGFHEAMEYSSGLIGMIEVALDYQNDTVRPDSHLVVTSRTASTTTFSFDTSEPATVYYTVDGSRPTTESAKLMNASIRDEAESITVENGAVVNWFSIDARGNVENGYNHAGTGGGYESWYVTAGGTTYDDILATIDMYLDDDRMASHKAASLRDRIVRAEAMAATGSETRTIGLLEQFIARAKNQLNNDPIARDALVNAAEQLIKQLEEAEGAENAENDAA